MKAKETMLNNPVQAGLQIVQIHSMAAFPHQRPAVRSRPLLRPASFASNMSDSSTGSSPNILSPHRMRGMMIVHTLIDKGMVSPDVTLA